MAQDNTLARSLQGVVGLVVASLVGPVLSGLPIRRDRSAGWRMELCHLHGEVGFSLSVSPGGGTLREPTRWSRLGNL
jgi:hypothetical protein